ncbi:response regulator [Thiohalocapsa halophila]
MTQRPRDPDTNGARPSSDRQDASTRNTPPAAAPVAAPAATPLGALFHASPMAIAFTVDRVFHEVNDSLCALSGYRRDELIGRSTSLLYGSQAAYATVGEAGYAAVAADGVARMQGQLRRKDGQILDIALHLAALTPGDLANGVVGSILDNTAQQRAQALLRARAEISEAVAAGDRDALLHSTLREALALTRSTTARFAWGGAGGETPAVAWAVSAPDGGLCTGVGDDGATDGETAADDALARCRRRSAAAARTGAAVGLAQRGPPARDRALAVPLPQDAAGTAVLAVADKEAVYLGDEAELLRELVSMAADGLEALRARAALHASEADLRAAETRLRVALDGAGLGLYEVDLVTGEADVDERYLSQLGLSRADAVTVERWTDLIHPDDREPLQGAAADAFAGRVTELDTEYRMRHADGGWRWIMDRWRVYARDEHGTLLRVAGVHLDITARKQAEERLAELNRTLEARVAEQTAELRSQAEQLRALANQLTRSEQRERKRLASILHDHIQQLIVAAKMQVGRLTRNADQARQRAAAQGAEEVLEEALAACRSMAVELSPPVLHESGLGGGLKWLATRMHEHHGLTVRLWADTGAEPADEEVSVLLFECARELLLNVAKHAGVAQAEAALTRRNGTEMQLSVADAGVGFEPAELKALRPEEMSFGLFSIQQRLAHLGGRMDLESAPGRGTRVSLVVPVAEGAAVAEGTAGAPTAPSPAPITTRRRPLCRVLIVDDHQIVREGLAGLLQVEPDIDVVGEAADAEQALALATEREPDIVIMDINLGAGMDGIEATRRLCAQHAEITVIGLSMHADQQIADAMRAAGAVAYVTKGGPPEDLISAIRTHADRRGP